MTNVRKVSLSLDPHLVDGLDSLSKRLGLSRSALVNLTLGEVVPRMSGLLAEFPDQPDESDARRLRGKSIQLIHDEYGKVISEMIGNGDLFS